MNVQQRRMLDLGLDHFVSRVSNIEQQGDASSGNLVCLGMVSIQARDGESRDRHSQGSDSHCRR